MAEFQETSPTPERREPNPLLEKIKNNLNWPSILDIARGGRKRWGYVLRQTQRGLSPEKFTDEMHEVYQEETEAIAKAGLERLEWNFDYPDDKGIAIGCQIPTEGYQLTLPPYYLKGGTPHRSIHTVVPPGKWLELPVSTASQNRLNNGLSVIERNGEIRSVNGLIEPSKGSLVFALTENTHHGSFRLQSPLETQALQTNPNTAHTAAPHEGFIIGTPIYTELSYGHKPQLRDVFPILEQSHYFKCWNTEFPFFVQIDSDMYYINHILGNSRVYEHASIPQPNTTFFKELRRYIKNLTLAEEVLSKDYGYSPNLALATLFALQTASTLLKPGQHARLAMTEQAFVGRLGVKDDQYQMNAGRPLFARAIESQAQNLTNK